VAFALFDRIQETASASGTGAYTLAGAVATYRAFSSVYSNGDTFPYVALGATSGAWETGRGTYNTGGTISRALSSSSTGALISWGAETINIWVGFTSGTILPQSMGGTGATSLAAPLVVNNGVLGLSEYVLQVAAGSPVGSIDIPESTWSSFFAGAEWVRLLIDNAKGSTAASLQVRLYSKPSGGSSTLKSGSNDYTWQYILGQNNGTNAGWGGTLNGIVAGLVFNTAGYSGLSDILIRTNVDGYSGVYPGVRSIVHALSAGGDNAPAGGNMAMTVTGHSLLYAGHIVTGVNIIPTSGNLVNPTRVRLRAY